MRKKYLLLTLFTKASIRAEQTRGAAMVESQVTL